MTKFLDKYKVLLTAIAAALTLVLQQFIVQPTIDYKALGIAAIIAVTGTVGNYLRGQYVSMAGIIGIAIMTIEQVLSGAVINLHQILLSLGIAILALVAPPAKALDEKK